MPFPKITKKVLNRMSIEEQKELNILKNKNIDLFNIFEKAMNEHSYEYEKYGDCLYTRKLVDQAFDYEYNALETSDILQNYIISLKEKYIPFIIK